MSAPPGGLREELLSRGILLTYLVCLITTTTEGTTNLLYPLFLHGHGYDLSAVGALSSLAAVLKLASRVPVGARYRGSTARREQIGWLLVFVASTSGFAFTGGALLPVAALTIVHGFAFGALSTINLAVAIDISGGRRAGSVMGWYTAALSAGYAVGAFAAGALADALGVGGAFLWLGLSPLLAIVAVRLTPLLSDAARAAPSAGVRWWRRGLAAFAAIDGRVWLAFAVVLFINLLSDSTDTFFPIYGTAIGLPVALVGGLKGAKSASATVIRFLSGAVFRVVDFRAINFWAVIVFAAATFVIPYARDASWALFAVFLLAGLCRGILRVTSAATVAELKREGREIGLASGVYNAGLDIGSIIGPAAGGWLADGLGIPLMFQVLAVASLVLYFAVALSSPAGRGALMLAPGARTTEQLGPR